MSRLVLVLLLATGLAGCSTRRVVVVPEELPKLNDAQWTITSEPARSR